MGVHRERQRDKQRQGETEEERQRKRERKRNRIEFKNIAIYLLICVRLIRNTPLYFQVSLCPLGYMKQCAR